LTCIFLFYNHCYRLGAGAAEGSLERRPDVAAENEKILVSGIKWHLVEEAKAVKNIGLFFILDDELGRLTLAYSLVYNGKQVFMITVFGPEYKTEVMLLQVTDMWELIFLFFVISGLKKKQVPILFTFRCRKSIRTQKFQRRICNVRPLRYYKDAV
jgi:hypothetical protein